MLHLFATDSLGNRGYESGTLITRAISFEERVESSDDVFANKILQAIDRYQQCCEK